MYRVYSTTGEGWHLERSFDDYATACRFATQLENRNVRATVRRGGAA